ncbi:MAG: hypothetical protein ACK53Y_07030, partial [bacterium]
SSEEREKVKELRKARKRARRNTPGAGTRNSSAIQRVNGDESDEDDSSYNDSASDNGDGTNNISAMNRDESVSPSSPSTRQSVTPTRQSGRLIQS